MTQTGNRFRAGLTAALLLATPALAKASQLPKVVSLNVCTDQLAMLLAAPGQLKSVSALARDPALSPLHTMARGLPVNRGRAEEVFLLKPDVVVTGTFSLHNATSVLRRLGFKVEAFNYTQSLETVPADIRRMGRLLGREAEGERTAAQMEHDLASFKPLQCRRKPLAIAYGQRGIALGKGTLADSVLQAAGYENLATKTGHTGMSAFALEQLVENPPDLIILPAATASAPALADMAMEHPVLKKLAATRSARFSRAALWSCGGPFTVQAVKELREIAKGLPPCRVEPGS